MDYDKKMTCYKYESIKKTTCVNYSVVLIYICKLFYFFIK